MEIKKEEMAHPVEALEVLEGRDQDELNHEQKITYENLSRHCKIRDLDTLDELKEELEEVESLKEQHIYKLLELVPQHESTVRAIFSKERIKLEDDEIEKILEICQSIETEE